VKTGFGFLLVPLALAAGCVETGPVDPASSSLGEPDCRIVRVIDGDTVDMICQGVGGFRARLVGFDTPEVYSPGCGAELAAGQQATRLLRRITASAPVTSARLDGQDRYGRLLVRIEVGGQDVANQMIASGLALPYAGGQRPDWCTRLSA
jgi:micrococcal nuclease